MYKYATKEKKNKNNLYSDIFSKNSLAHYLALNTF